MADLKSPPDADQSPGASPKMLVSTPAEARLLMSAKPFALWSAADLVAALRRRLLVAGLAGERNGSA